MVRGVRPFDAACWGVVAAIAAVRVRLSGMPLERDEAGESYIARSLLSGEAPLEGAFSLKLPGAAWWHALAQAVPAAPDVAARVVAALAVVLSCVFLAVALRARLGRPAAAAAALACFVTSARVMGPTANTEPFVVCAVTAAMAVHAGWRRRTWTAGRAVGCGALLGLACVTKHHAVFFAAALVAEAAFGGARRTPGQRAATAALVIAGASLPVLAVLAHCAVGGTFADARLWWWSYARSYTDMVPLAQGLRTGASQAADVLRWVWPLAALGAAGVSGACFLRRRAARRAARTWPLWLASAAAVSPGLYFREHYFILCGPAFAAVAGVGLVQFGRFASRLAGLGRRAARGAAAAAVAAACGGTWAPNWNVWMASDLDAASDGMFLGNPFAEARDIAAEVRARARPGDRVFVLGSEPQIPVYAGLRSATRFIYTYPLGEAHPRAAEFREAFLADLERRDARFVAVVNNPFSWLDRTGARAAMRDRMVAVLRDYECVAIAFSTGSRARWRTGDPPPEMKGEWISLYQRRTAR